MTSFPLIFSRLICAKLDAVTELIRRRTGADDEGEEEEEEEEEKEEKRSERKRQKREPRITIKLKGL